MKTFEQKAASKILLQLKAAIYAKNNSSCKSEFHMNVGAVIELRVLIFNLFSLSNTLPIEEIFKKLDQFAKNGVY